MAPRVSAACPISKAPARARSAAQCSTSTAARRVRFHAGGNGVTAGSGTLGTGAQAGGAIYSLGYNATAAAGSVGAALLLHNSILAGSSGGFDLVVNRPAMVSGGLSSASATTVTALGVNLVMSALAENGAGALPAASLER